MRQYLGQCLLVWVKIMQHHSDLRDEEFGDHLLAYAVKTMNHHSAGLNWY